MGTDHRPMQFRGSLNVLMVNTHQTGGGAGRVGQLLAGELNRRGHRVRSFVAANPTGEPDCQVVTHWRAELLASWLKRHGLPELGNFTSFFWPLRAQYAEADLLHLHNLHGNYLSVAALPLWGLQKPLVWTLHDCWPLTGNCATPRDCTRWLHACGRCRLLGQPPMATVDRSSFYRRVKPGLIAAARPRLVVPSNWLASLVRRIGHLRRLPLRVIRCPIDCDLFQPPATPAGQLRKRFGLVPDWPTVVLCGNNWTDPLKGGRDATRALRGAASRLPRLQVLVIGHGSEALLQATGLPGRALPFLESRQKLAEAYACADLCLFPSRAENYPVTILESLACQTPVVAYDVGGIPEQIQHRRTGYLAHDGEVAELAVGIIALLSDLAHTRQMGREGRQFVLRTSSIPVVVKQYEDEYRAAVREWCGRSGRGSPRTKRGCVCRWLAGRLGWTDRVDPPSDGHTGRPRPSENRSADTGRSVRQPDRASPPLDCLDHGGLPAASGPESVRASEPPMISVVTPSFNQGRFIERCIQSVLAQNYPRFEHIIYDNCSTDQTLSILRRYPHLCWVSEPDRGQSDALNKAIRRSRGQIIAWINADDYYEPGAFAVAARELGPQTGNMVILGRVKLVDAEGRLLGMRCPEYRGHEFLLDVWSHDHGLSQQGMFFRREALERVGLLDCRLHYAMDYDLWLRLTRHFPIKTVDEVLASFVLHPHSKTGQSRYLSGFLREQERASRRWWGSVLSRQYWRLRRACDRGAGKTLLHALLHSHKHDRKLDWSLLPQLLRHRPGAIANRYVLAVIAERLGLKPGRASFAVAGPAAATSIRRCRARNNGRVTVVIPTYNRAELLPRCIRSVLAQTARDRCDIVVVDDGSTDHTPEVIRQFAAEVSYIRQNNAGVSAARNLGIRSRPNQFVAFLDSDDTWEPDKIERQLEIFRRYPQTVFVAAHTVRRAQSGQEWSFRLPPIPLDQPCDLAPHLFERLFLLTSSIMARTHDLVASGGFYTGLKRAEDHLLWAQLACRGPAVYLSDRLVTMGWHTPFSLSADRIASTLAELRVFYLLRPALRARPDCRDAWRRGLKRTLSELHAAAAGQGDWARATIYALRTLGVSPLQAPRWKWGRLGRSILRLLLGGDGMQSRRWASVSSRESQQGGTDSPGLRAAAQSETNRRRCYTVAASPGAQGEPRSADRPLISVITPSCNHGRFIERCIRSVLDQGYPAFEHVVYDNCSSDHTVAILRRYPHLIWASEPDRGQSHALNKALARAQGEIIGWINADDMYQPGAFEVAARELGAGCGVQAIAGRVHLLDQAGNVIHTKTPTISSLDSLVRFWEPGFCLDQCGVFFRREVVEEIGGLDEELHYAMDYEFFLRLLARFRLKLVDAVLAGFTVHPDSKTGRGDRHWQFLAERQRASSRYWGPPGSRRYRQFSRACNRHLADQVAKGLLRAHRSGGQLDWRGLAKAAALDPSRLLSRPILGMLAERAVGPRVTPGLRQAGHARKKIPSTCSIWPVRWSQNPGSSDISV